ncbi:transposable element Tc1 transposase [Trichonephila clavipes]|nr:transposable element Tc1 transposase [Trichonephila clavipes]
MQTVQIGGVMARLPVVRHPCSRACLYRVFFFQSLVNADKPQTLDHLEDNIRRVIADVRPQIFEKVIENWSSRLDYIRGSRGSPMPEIIFKILRSGDWHQVFFSDESRFTLWNHGGRIRRRCAGERCLPECVIERHSGLIPGVMVWGAISYHGRSNLLRFEGNLNSNRYVHEVLQPEVVPFLQGIHGAVFQQYNTRPHVAKTVRDFCSAQHMQLLP